MEKNYREIYININSYFSKFIIKYYKNLIYFNLIYFSLDIILIYNIKISKMFSYRNVRCGSLQCQQGSKQPVIEEMKDYYSRTIISIKSQEYECK